MKKFLSFLVFSIFLFFVGCRKPQAFQYRDLRNFKVNSIGANKSRVSMDFIFFNPNTFPVDLRNVDCDVYLDSNYVGKFLLDTSMHINKTSEFVLPANFDVDMKNVLKNSFSLLFSNEVLVGARGTTRVGRSGIFVTIPFKYEGRQRLALF